MSEPVGFSRGGFSSGGGGGAAAGSSSGSAAALTPETVSVQSIPYSIGYAIGMVTAPSYASAVIGVANRGFFIPFWVPSAITVAQLWCQNGGTAAGNTDMGIYDATFNKVVTIGPTAQAGTSAIQYFNIADTGLSAATNYYLALVTDNTGATFGRVSVALQHLNSIGVFTDEAVGTLPASVVPDSCAQAYIPHCGFTTRSSV